MCVNSRLNDQLNKNSLYTNLPGLNYCVVSNWNVAHLQKTLWKYMGKKLFELIRTGYLIDVYIRSKKIHLWIGQFQKFHIKSKIKQNAILPLMTLDPKII